jgi:hypothetical protein
MLTKDVKQILWLLVRASPDHTVQISSKDWEQVPQDPVFEYLNDPFTDTLTLRAVTYEQKEEE